MQRPSCCEGAGGGTANKNRSFVFHISSRWVFCNLIVVHAGVIVEPCSDGGADSSDGERSVPEMVQRYPSVAECDLKEGFKQ